MGDLFSGLDLSQIQSVGDDFPLFDTGDTGGDDTTQTTGDGGNSQQETGNQTTEKVDINHLFDTPPANGEGEGEGNGQSSEGVGSENNNQKSGDTSSGNGGGTSPNVYASLAQTVADEGVYSLSEEDIAKIDSPEAYIDMLKAQRDAMLDEAQKRVLDALDAGVEKSEIQQYEGNIKQLEGISQEQLEAEDENGKRLRQWVIYNDYLSKGISQERANKMTQQSITAGTDIDDAKEALESIKTTVKGEYSRLIKEAQAEAAKEAEAVKKQAENLKKGMLEGEKVFGDITVTPDMRKKAYEAITKPVYKDPDTGDVLTEVQKYQKEHPEDFLKNVGFLYAMSKGFSDMNLLVKSKVQKEVNRGIRQLANALNNTSRTNDGNINFASGVNDDDGYIGKGIKLAL